MAIDLDDYVRVKNGTSRKIIGRYNGVDYEFHPGRSKDVPISVAAHVFGFGKDEKSKEAVFARLGWANTSEQLDAAREELGKITFDAIPNIPGADEDFADAGKTLEDATPSRHTGLASDAPSSLPMGVAGAAASRPPRISLKGVSEEEGKL
jgi:hypothetical protein